jgi:hypothetical protein
VSTSFTSSLAVRKTTEIFAVSGLSSTTTRIVGLVVIWAHSYLIILIALLTKQHPARQTPLHISLDDLCECIVRIKRILHNMTTHVVSYFPYLPFFYILEGEKVDNFLSITQPFSRNSKQATLDSRLQMPAFSVYLVFKRLES